MSITSFSSLLSLCNNNNHNDKIHWDQNNNIYNILFSVGINIYILEFLNIYIYIIIIEMIR